MFSKELEEKTRKQYILMDVGVGGLSLFVVIGFTRKSDLKTGKLYMEGFTR